MQTQPLHDYLIVGAGIIGLTTAWALRQSQPDATIAIIEKEPDVATHQTGHNSGVIHAGVYYQPGSLKADFCRRGAEQTKAFCTEHNIPFETRGKLIVATNALELERLKALKDRTEKLGVDTNLIDRPELRRLEPAIDGLSALSVKESAIVSFAAIATKLSRLLKDQGVQLFSNNELIDAHESDSEVILETNTSTFRAKKVICCTGLMADRTAKLMGLEVNFAILPFRGEYYRLPDHLGSLVHHLIYPVPDPALPFLGVHLTPMINGMITVGPNAVLGLKREGYSRRNISLRDSWEIMLFAGSWRLARHYAKAGLSELIGSWHKPSYLKRAQKYCPQLRLEDLKPYPAGVRAQAVSHTGKLVEDFLFLHTKRTLHVANAPSPAATSAFPIGRHIAEKILQIDP